jgi:putative transposase
LIYHVLNRGNGRMWLFHKDEDFAAFERVLAEGLERYPVDLLTYCLMGNHWHLVMRPRTDDALGRLMGWVGVTHVRRHHQHYHTRGGGHLYQGRFKGFPVQDDAHFLAVCRYVEANALRAGLVRRAENWRWGGLYARAHRGKPFTPADWPVDRPRNWAAAVNEALDDKMLEQLRTCVNRGRPCGREQWVQRTAKRLGLTFTLRNPGRPRKPKEKENNE